MADIFFLDPNPLLDDALVQRLIYDMAAGIHEPPEIAVRYGFPDKIALRAYLKKHPGIIKNIQKAKSLMESDEASEARVRLKATQAVEALIAPTANIAWDPHFPAQQRIDAFKQLSRVGGLDGSAAAQALRAGAGGPAFTLNILFRDRPTEMINVTPDDGASEGAIGAGWPAAALTSEVNPDPDDDLDEEV
jgi:hypothetical protein